MSDYYVFTACRGEQRNAWYWEIRRHSAAMGVRLTDGGMQSEQAAMIAGTRALDEFLAALDKEERRTRSPVHRRGTGAPKGKPQFLTL